MSLPAGTASGSEDRAADGSASERASEEPLTASAGQVHGRTQQPGAAGIRVPGPSGDGAAGGAAGGEGAVRDSALGGVSAGGEEDGSGAPQLPATGDVAVDEALQDLPGLLDRPLEEQVEGYTAIHGRLQDRLADLDG